MHPPHSLSPLRLRPRSRELGAWARPLHQCAAVMPQHSAVSTGPPRPTHCCGCGRVRALSGSLLVPRSDTCIRQAPVLAWWAWTYEGLLGSDVTRAGVGQGRYERGLSSQTRSLLSQPKQGMGRGKPPSSMPPVAALHAALCVALCALRPASVAPAIPPLPLSFAFASALPLHIACTCPTPAGHGMLGCAGCVGCAARWVRSNPNPSICPFLKVSRLSQAGHVTGTPVTLLTGSPD